MPYKNLELNPIKYTETLRQTDYHIYKGFSSVNDDSSVKLFDFDLVKQDIINQFATKKGERLMNPQFGTIIYDLIMEPLTDDVRNHLSNDIISICNSDPRVSPLDIKVNEYEQGYLVEITLLYKNTNETSTLRLAFDQKVGIRTL